jgi:predicted dehydrogenase
MNRRSFLAGTVPGIAGILLARRAPAAAAADGPRLRVACVGAGGRGVANIQSLAGSTGFVAFADVDENRAASMYKKFPAVRRFRDYRKMLDAVGRDIDAVVVSTPDHTHAAIALAAIRMGKHVYCEKPLAHSVAEVRALVKAAREHKVVTQLGNQGHSSSTIRTFCEWIRDGAIGGVHTIHACCRKAHSRIRDLPKLAEKHDVPATLDWDLWLGPAPFHPYHPLYMPGTWRDWRPFGTDTIGDWTCHVVDPVFWALDLGAPSAVTAKVTDGFDPKAHADTFPLGSQIEFEFPAKGARKTVRMIWYDGSQKPPRPPDLEADRQPPDTGAIVVGDKGTITYGSHGAGSVRIIPEAKMQAYKRPPESIPRVKGHHEDWLSAIREGRQAGSNFDYGGPLTEIALLGAIAQLFPGTRLEWDGPAGRFTNCNPANALLSPPAPRPGWGV